jgi:YcxB-like protein
MIRWADDVEVSYINTVSDLASWNRYDVLRHPYLYLLTLIVSLLALAANVMVLTARQFLVWLVVLIALQPVVFLGVYVLTCFSIYLFLLLRRDAPAHRQHTITLTETAVVEESPVNRTESSWAGVVKVARNRRLIFIYIASNLAHVIPKRAFASEAEAASFFTQATEFWSRAHNAA